MAKVKDLKPNTFNPRKITGAKKDALAKSLKEFGDLGGIVFNSESGSIVSGHQRSSILPPGAKITIEKKFEKPTATGTVAIGFIEDETGERFSYREVRWSKQKETEALLAANKHSGEWDHENLRVLFSEVPEIRVELTGFEIPELKAMDIKVSPVQIKKVELTRILGGKADPQETDEEYLKKSAGPQEEAERERLPDLINRTYPEKPGPEPVKEVDPPKGGFENTNETTTPQGRQIVLIIKCETDEAKASIKKEIQEKVEEMGGKFF